jgi:hypothetical protein
MDNLEEELQRRIELQMQHQRERENQIVERTNSFLRLMFLVRAKYVLNETKLKALEKIKQLGSEEKYEYALRKYKQES